MSIVPSPQVLEAAGAPPKTISEFIGRLTTNEVRLSIAVMSSPSGWSEPGQRPDFDEFTVVLEGEVMVETETDSFTAAAGQAVHAPAGTWVRYSTPSLTGAKYVAVCLRYGRERRVGARRYQPAMAQIGRRPGWRLRAVAGGYHRRGYGTRRPPGCPQSRAASSALAAGPDWWMAEALTWWPEVARRAPG
jgi:quercetin dioxygenase-like cupin family protein